MKIAIAGKFGSGKSYLAQLIQEKYSEKSFVRTSFAKKVKTIANDLFYMDEKNRSLLIQIGESMKLIDKNVWVNAMFQDIGSEENVILDDLRFHNEYESLIEKKWFIILIRTDENVRESRIRDIYPTLADDHFKNMTSHTENEVAEYSDRMFDCVIHGSNYDELFIFLDLIVY